MFDLNREPTYNINMLIDTKYIQMTIDNHEEAHDNDDMDVVAELDNNLHEIKLLLNKIENMEGHVDDLYKASAASEIIIEAVEHVWDYIRN